MPKYSARRALLCKLRKIESATETTAIGLKSGMLDRAFVNKQQ